MFTRYLHFLLQSPLVPLAVVASVLSAFVLSFGLLRHDLMPAVAGMIAALMGAGLAVALAQIMYGLRNRRSVFLSYAHQDTDFAMKLVDDLRKMNVEPIVDRLELKVGEDIRTAVDRMMEEADYFLFVVSDNSMKSDWTKKELEQAIARKKGVLPVVLNPKALPESLSGVFYADFSKEYEQGLFQLRKTFRRTRTRLTGQSKG